jgi:hypothetical protein
MPRNISSQQRRRKRKKKMMNNRSYTERITHRSSQSTIFWDTLSHIKRSQRYQAFTPLPNIRFMLTEHIHEMCDA